MASIENIYDKNYYYQSRLIETKQTGQNIPMEGKLLGESLIVMTQTATSVEGD